MAFTGEETIWNFEGASTTAVFGSTSGTWLKENGAGLYPSGGTATARWSIFPTESTRVKFSVAPFYVTFNWDGMNEGYSLQLEEYETGKYRLNLRASHPSGLLVDAGTGILSDYVYLDWTTSSVKEIMYVRDIRTISVYEVVGTSINLLVQLRATFDGFAPQYDKIYTTSMISSSSSLFRLRKIMRCAIRSRKYADEYRSEYRALAQDLFTTTLNPYNPNTSNGGIYGGEMNFYNNAMGTATTDTGVLRIPGSMPLATFSNSNNARNSLPVAEGACYVVAVKPANGGFSIQWDGMGAVSRLAINSNIGVASGYAFGLIQNGGKGDALTTGTATGYTEGNWVYFKFYGINSGRSIASSATFLSVYAGTATFDLPIVLGTGNLLNAYNLGGGITSPGALYVGAPDYTFNVAWEELRIFSISTGYASTLGFSDITIDNRIAISNWSDNVPMRGAAGENTVKFIDMYGRID